MSGVRVWLETTQLEVVDVTVESADAALAKCMLELAWAVVLPTEFERRAHDIWDMKL